MDASDVLSAFAPDIAERLQVILTEGKVGICAGVLKMADISTGCCTTERGSCMDRFKIILPFAGQQITWEIIFNSHCPDKPPDFIFAAEDNFEPHFDNLPSLLDWDSKEPGALLAVLQELYVEYKQYQLEMISQSSRLQFEYTSLIEQSDFSENEIEVLVSKRNGGGRFGPVSFLIKLRVDFSKIPQYLTKESPGEDTAVLCVTFQTLEGGKATPQLYLSPRVEKCLGPAANLRIPSFPSGGCLIDYVPTVCDLLKNKVDHVVQGFEKRRELISAFLNRFHRSILEYDTEAFRSISFLLEWHDFFFVFTVELGLLFPMEPPVFTFQSIYHEMASGQPYSRVVREPPHSPRWSASEMVERARSYILEHISNFQRGSVTEGSYR